MTISANNILFKEKDKLDLAFIYQILDELSNQFHIYLIILVNENEDTSIITEKLSMLIDDGIVQKQRILYTSKLEGLCAMVRSIDPFIHVESQSFVISNLIRFINQFWFINLNKENIEKIINDSTTTNNTSSTLMTKVKQFNNLQDTLSKEKLNLNKK